MIKMFKIMFVLICLLIQILFIYILYLLLINNVRIVGLLYSIYCMYFILKIIKKSKSYSFTLPWIIVFLILPIPGSLLYIIINKNLKNSTFINKIISEEDESKKYLKQESLDKDSCSSIMNYISNYSKYPITNNNDVEYYPLGDLAYKPMLDELKNAKKFIFMEYFIIKHGKMWSSILNILEEKVKEGVEVRLMYDDFGCFYNLNSSYCKNLEKKGIKCISFNKLKPFGGVVMNNRDHRKILVIDGIVAFSGGINLADEYINIGSKYGHWKDNSIKITGDAVWSYTVMFLTLWNAVKKEDDNYEVYKYKFKKSKTSKGFVAPYGQNPFDGKNVGEDVYLNIINRANNYLYICTPYLIIDTDIINALILAAKRGVDVRIIIPAIPDKKIVYTLSESYIEPLAQVGVKIYKYTPGFIHSKVFVSDDIKATVGTINMDYRSLYMHFECGCYFELEKVIKNIKNDLVETIEKSHLVTKKEAQTGYLKSFWQSILRLFAPLM